MNITDIILKVQQSNPDCVQFRFKTRTTPKLTKKNRTTGEPTNFTVAVESEFTASLGVDYQAEVNAVLAETGCAADFKAQKPSGKHYVHGTNWLMESDTNPGRFYVALSRFADRKTRYLVDGAEADQAKVSDLYANYLPKPGKSAPVVEWRTYSLDSVVSAEPVA